MNSGNNHWPIGADCILFYLGGFMFVYYNPNPEKKNVGDCTIRALSKALGQSWEKTYIGVVLQGYQMGDMPSANHVWGAYLREHGYRRNLAEEDTTVNSFADGNPEGTYILALSGHVVCVQDGTIYDTWDSGNRRSPGRLRKGIGRI